MQPNMHQAPMEQKPMGSAQKGNDRGVFRRSASQLLFDKSAQEYAKKQGEQEKEMKR